MLGRFWLECPECTSSCEDRAGALSCEEHMGSSLLRTVYQSRQIAFRDDMPGMFRYIDWLPTDKPINVNSRPVTYRSEGLARELGLENLFISFNGYWPEVGASMETCTFKELEAPPTVARYLSSRGGTMVLASAGNTARAFAYTCSKAHVPVWMVVPDCGLESLWLPFEAGEGVRLVSMSRGNDYTDAIKLADRIASLEGFYPEGGARNVARRDGMGVVLLNAVEEIGVLPDHYFQAVGSGVGAIAAWEANLRLIGDGRFGDNKIALHLSQNLPFTPMVDAWTHGRREIALDQERARSLVQGTYSSVLTNRMPPYSIRGGVYDALSDTGGKMYGVTERNARNGMSLFESVEGIDIVSAAGVAVASLVQAVESRMVGSGDIILLNVTGGGEGRFRGDREPIVKEPDVTVDGPDADVEALARELGGA